MTTLFISDLHLAENRPDITASFIQFLHQQAVHAEALYILGDLFEFWTGDEDPSAFAQLIRSELRQVTDQGVPIFFIQGNRDFLLGERFCYDTGMTLLSDVNVIDLYGRRVVILHGDTLCTDDVKYQAFRAKVHLPWLQWIFKRLPWFVKQHIVRKVQRDIRDDKQTKSMTIMDVNQAAVEHVMIEHNVDLMIHGHTHRPNTHHFDVNGVKTRIVLGDWYEQSSILVVTADDLQLQQHALTHINLIH